jgi:serine protease
VDVTAPGVDVLSAVNASSGKVLGSISGDYSGQGPTDTAQNRAFYANFSGTSMSGPHVAGLVALMRQVSPTLTPAEIRFLVTATARDLLAEGRDIGAGYGMVDATAVLDAAARHAAGAEVRDLFPEHTFVSSL